MCDREERSRSPSARARRRGRRRRRDARDDVSPGGVRIRRGVNAKDWSSREFFSKASATRARRRRRDGDSSAIAGWCLVARRRFRDSGGASERSNLCPASASVRFRDRRRVRDADASRPRRRREDYRGDVQRRASNARRTSVFRVVAPAHPAERRAANRRVRFRRGNTRARARASSRVVARARASKSRDKRACALLAAAARTRPKAPDARRGVSDRLRLRRAAAPRARRRSPRQRSQNDARHIQGRSSSVAARARAPSDPRALVRRVGGDFRRLGDRATPSSPPSRPHASGGSLAPIALADGARARDARSEASRPPPPAAAASRPSRAPQRRRRLARPRARGARRRRRRARREAARRRFGRLASRGVKPRARAAPVGAGTTVGHHRRDNDHGARGRDAAATGDGRRLSNVPHRVASNDRPRHVSASLLRRRPRRGDWVPGWRRRRRPTPARAFAVMPPSRGLKPGEIVRADGRARVSFFRLPNGFGVSTARGRALLSRARVVDGRPPPTGILRWGTDARRPTPRGAVRLAGADRFQFEGASPCGPWRKDARPLAKMRRDSIRGLGAPRSNLRGRGRANVKRTGGTSRRLGADFLGGGGPRARRPRRRPEERARKASLTGRVRATGSAPLGSSGAGNARAQVAAAEAVARRSSCAPSASSRVSPPHRDTRGVLPLTP